MSLLIKLMFLLCVLTKQLDAAKILIVMPVKSTSHMILVMPLLKELTARGHEITLISSFAQEQPIRNLRDIPALQHFKGFSDQARDGQTMKDKSLWENFENMIELSANAATYLLQQHQVQQLLINRNETFDLVIIDMCLSEALFGFAAHFRAPLIGIASFGAHAWHNALTGAPTLPAFMPYTFISQSENMAFGQRLLNFCAFTLDYFYMALRYMPRHERIFAQYFKHTGQTLADMRQNVSLMLLNQHSSLGVRRPNLPNMIEIGGMHISNETSALPGDIQTFLDEASEGAIYFSLGSNINAADLPPAKLNVILKTLRALPQRVLWKFEIANVPDIPANVFISNWFPQSDVLAHRNVKLFITHGGLLSLTESIAQGKPLLIIPFFADQHANMQRFKGLGVALDLEFNELSDVKFGHAIQELLTNASFTEVAVAMSQRFHDRPQSALETGVYWVEYVMRHRGAPHLHCAALNLNVLQYHGLDVLALLLAFILLLSSLFFVLLRGLFKLCLRVNAKAKRKAKKQ